MRNLKLILAVMALTALPVTQVAAQQVIMMPVQSQEVAMVNVTGDSNLCSPHAALDRKPLQPHIPSSPTMPPAPATAHNPPSAIYN
jgi:hypothetical protein